MTLSTRPFVTVALVALMALAQAADYPPTSALSKHTFSGTGGSLPYRMFVPAAYTANAGLPLVIFLHGAGEVGTDNEQQLGNNANGALWLVNTEYQSTRPMLFCAPQTAGGWSSSTVISLVGQLVNDLLSRYPGISPDRVIITGLSLGGGGTYSQLGTNPGLYAGAVPMQGPGRWADISKHPTMNIWHFHAANDNSGYHPIGTADYCVGFLRGAGLNVVYTRYATGGHGIWSVAYKTPALIEWIWALRRGQVVSAAPVTAITTNAGGPLVTDQSAIALAGASGDSSAAITGLAWSTNRSNASGNCLGTAAWSVASVPLATGDNRVLITATGTSWSSSYGGNTTSNDTILVTRGAVANTAPTISAIANQTLAEDGILAALTVTVGDTETLAGSLTLSGTSANPALVPNASIAFSGSGAARTVTITPAPNQNGTTTVTITVSDGTLSAARTFTVTVSAVNDAPSLSPVANQTIGAGTSTPALAFTVSDVETTASALTVTASAVDALLLPASGISFGGSGSGRTVILTPAVGRWGSTVVTLQVSDGVTTVSTAFTLTVQAQQAYNVLQGKTATASSVYQDYLANRAVDGVDTTTTSRWLSLSGAAEEWISIDLGGTYAIDRIAVLTGYNGAYPVSAFTLEYDAGSGWTAIPGGAVSGNTAVDRIMSLAAPIRLQRLRLRSPDTDHVRIRELQAFGIPVGNG